MIDNTNNNLYNFHYTAANGYELNNLDNEALDAPVYNTMCNNPTLNNQPYQDGINNDFTSLPCETFLMSSHINSNQTNVEDEFSYKNPMYQSAHVQVKSKPIINDDENYHVENSEEGIHLICVFILSSFCKFSFSLKFCCFIL